MVKIMQKKRTEIVHSSTQAGQYRIKCPSHEIKEGLAELSANGFRLFMYLTTCNSCCNFDDDNMCKVLGFKSVRTLQGYRKELKSLGYLHVAKGKEVDVYYVGKQAVVMFKG